MAETSAVRDAVRRVLRRTRDWTWPYVAAGKTGAAAMRLVRATSSITYEPGHPFDIYAHLAPFIMTTWHGQHLMVTLMMRRDTPTRALVSKSRDGDMSAAFMGSFGIQAVRGSGGRDRRHTVEKGGARALLQMKRALEEGASVATIADISNTVRRHCGEGVIALARMSGRPIIPMGFATSRWHALDTWDQATIHLPFSRGAVVSGSPIEVPRDADENVIEAKRQEVERSINAAVDRAYAIVGKNRDW
jgi:lysophospholipid acyltransferase (LPLAT)-like uncharacterized protein